MKKTIIVLFTIIITLVSVSAIAETIKGDDVFSIRNGITFGMTKGEIQNIETSDNKSVLEKELEYTYFDENGEYRRTTTSGLRITGSLAGIENSILDYYFKNDELFAVTYYFGGLPNPNGILNLNTNIQNDYDVIQELLESKYSQIWISVDKNDMYPRITDCIYTDYGYAKFKEIDCYYIQLSDGSRIYINHVLFYKPITGSMEYDLMTGVHFLEYRLVTCEEMNTNNKNIAEKAENEVNEQIEDTTEKANQLESDL